MEYFMSWVRMDLKEPREGLLGIIAFIEPHSLWLSDKTFVD